MSFGKLHNLSLKDNEGRISLVFVNSGKNMSVEEESGLPFEMENVGVYPGYIKSDCHEYLERLFEISLFFEGVDDSKKNMSELLYAALENVTTILYSFSSNFISNFMKYLKSEQFEQFDTFNAEEWFQLMYKNGGTVLEDFIDSDFSIDDFYKNVFDITLKSALSAVTSRFTIKGSDRELLKYGVEMNKVIPTSGKFELITNKSCYIDFLEDDLRLELLESKNDMKIFIDIASLSIDFSDLYTKFHTFDLSIENFKGREGVTFDLANTYLIKNFKSLQVPFAACFKDPYKIGFKNPNFSFDDLGFGFLPNLSSTKAVYVEDLDMLFLNYDCVKHFDVNFED